MGQHLFLQYLSFLVKEAFIHIFTVVVCVIVDINQFARVILDLKILRTQVLLKETIFPIKCQTHGNGAVGGGKDIFYVFSFILPILLISLNYTKRINPEVFFFKFLSHLNCILKCLWQIIITESLFYLITIVL